MMSELMDGALDEQRVRHAMAEVPQSPNLRQFAVNLMTT